MKVLPKIQCARTRFEINLAVVCLNLVICSDIFCSVTVLNFIEKCDKKQQKLFKIYLTVDLITFSSNTLSIVHRYFCNVCALKYILKK